MSKKTSTAVETTEAPEQNKGEKTDIDAKESRSSTRLKLKREKNRMKTKTVDKIKKIAKKEIARSAKLYRSNTYPRFKRRVTQSFGETFFYNKNAGPEWQGVESTRYSRYHISKSMRFLQENMNCHEEQLKGKSSLFLLFWFKRVYISVPILRS